MSPPEPRPGARVVRSAGARSGPGRPWRSPRWSARPLRQLDREAPPAAVAVPATGAPSRQALALLALSALLLALAPLALPASYSWLRNGISESAAQGIDGAWVARAGFLTFGLAVVRLCQLTAGAWPPVGRALHCTFGLCMLGVTAVSTDPWIAGMPSVHSEALLHSILATVMGFAFILGAGNVGLVRLRAGRRAGYLDLAAAVAATALSAGMGAAPGIYGLLQRIMFAIGYLWYGKEAMAATAS